MQRPGRRTVGIVLGTFLFYLIAGPMIAEAAMPVFQTTATGSCTAVTTETNCCQDTYAAVGSPWATVHTLLSLPGAIADSIMDSGIQCMCAQPTIHWEPRQHDGQCRMVPTNWGLEAEARCGADGQLIINNTGEAIYEVWSVTVDGDEVVSPTDRFEVGPHTNRTLDQQFTSGNHTIEITAQPDMHRRLWTTTDQVSCP